MDKFLIAPYDDSSGLHNDVKPWLIPDQAFSKLNNVYQFRGRIRKKFGRRWLLDDPLLSRLRINLGTTDTSGALSTTVPLNSDGDTIATIAIGQQFSIGDEILTVTSLGNPVVLSTNGTSITHTLDTDTGALIIVGAATSTAIYYYPCLPVMGLLTLNTTLTNEEQTVAFDTRFAYSFNAGWDRMAAVVPTDADYWIGSNSQFFWGENWFSTDAFTKIFFVTNFNSAETEFIRYWDGTQWVSFIPQISNSNQYLKSARILVNFKNMLVALNTIEGDGNTSTAGDNYQNRARYSQVGSPLDLTQGWNQDIPGRGKAIDASTTEAITSCEFIRDRLIVYFERSTWELVYTGNTAYPFSWNKLNNELGAESTFSIVPFDVVALGVGNVGIVQCNATNVSRIDNAIPDEVFKIHNTDSGVERVYGIRDYSTEMVYWTFPSDSQDATQPFPNRVLVYNYKSQTWAFFDDTITCFGYIQPTDGVTWNSTTVTWDSDVTWDSGALQAQYRQVIGGNQQGYTFICDPDSPLDNPCLNITNISIADDALTVTCYNHNLKYGDVIFIENLAGSDSLVALNDACYVIAEVVSADTFIIYVDGVTGTYTSGGRLTLVPPIRIETKEFNPYIKQNRGVSMSKIGFLVDMSASGYYNVSYRTSSSLTSQPDFDYNGALILETLPLTDYEATESKFWHPVYINAFGEFVQLVVTQSRATLLEAAQRNNNFTLHALYLYCNPTSRLL